MALRKAKPEAEASTPSLPLVAVRDIVIAARPELGWHGIPSMTAEVVEVAQRLGLEVVHDSIARPSLSPADAAQLFAELTAPAPVVVDPPRPRQPRVDLPPSEAVQRRRWAAGRSVGTEVG
jgi:hypothetical protein